MPHVTEPEHEYGGLLINRQGAKKRKERQGCLLWNYGLANLAFLGDLAVNWILIRSKLKVQSARGLLLRAHPASFSLL